MMENYSNIDEYIAGFPETTREILKQLRATIRKSVPEAEEAISYGIPTFKLYGNLVHFAGYKNHIGFYPGATGIETFKDELSEYKLSKGTVQLPIDKPIPFDLISKIVDFRVKQNLSRAVTKVRKKK
jgi:uncharacterized protein YdhG (YjbR/CyaY superfamily)